MRPFLVVVKTLMRIDDFDFQLPDSLIAKHPLSERSSSRLLCLASSGDIAHRHFSDLVDYLNPGDLLVFNNTRVIPARLFGNKETGGKLEILIERMIDEHSALAHIRSSKSPRPDSFILVEGYRFKVTGREESLFQIQVVDGHSLSDVLESVGHMPLPPYIDRADTEEDKERYQTVFNKVPGAVAAPTAGLHFDQPLLDKLFRKGVEFSYVTLHVGAGTFQPVRVSQIKDHQMHKEFLQVDEDCCVKIRETKARGGRVVAIGTTAVRSLETAGRDGQITPFSGDTQIFIYPGYRFNVVDAMVTNFHLPKSTLLMLVSAFAGRDNILNAYHKAIENKYRFFSYGDAMFLQGPQV